MLENNKLTEADVLALAETPGVSVKRADLRKLDIGTMLRINTTHDNEYYAEVVTPVMPKKDEVQVFLMRRYGSQSGALSRGSLQLQTLDRVLKLNQRINYKDSKRSAKTGSVKKITILTMTEFEEPM